MRTIVIDLIDKHDEARAELAHVKRFVAEHGGVVLDEDWRHSRANHDNVLVAYYSWRLVVRVPDTVGFGYRYHPEVLRS